MTFWAYILRFADGSYYTGHTDDLERRVGQHQTGQVAGYTQKRRPVVLMWSQDFDSRYEALTAEAQIKGWSAPRKRRWREATGRHCMKPPSRPRKEPFDFAQGERK
ncbi:GIY-YIG nuclease family protein [Sphingomonas mollis]|uniref:GIY-YIG nuclease family protein n=1 Tax=Sphingomonas mollis TaxID=2795726 RepID=UPI001E540D0C|nr:GIY-YIG nuclease family protein [Sphingomonas sp. BT553]